MNSRFNIVLVIIWMVVHANSYSTKKSNVEKCQLTAWSEWGPCVRDPPCSAHSSPGKSGSYEKKPSRYDIGRLRMSYTMAVKRRLSSRTASCKSDKTCPQFALSSEKEPKNCVNGLAGKFPCRNVDMLSVVSIRDLGYGNPVRGDRYKQGNDIWGWTDPENGHEYVIMGLSGGTSFIDVTDPKKPLVLGFMYTQTGPSLWRDVKVMYGTAYIVAEARRHGLQVFDLTKLRGRKTFRVYKPDAVYSLFGKAHNIVANEESGYLYAVGDNDPGYTKSCRGGLHMINVKERLNPRFAGCFTRDGYTHDAQCVVYRGPDKAYYGREICFNYNEDSLTIVDVTNKARPQMVSKRGYRGSQYTHQGWLTDDHTLLLLDDELDEQRNRYDQRTKTLAWDVKNLRKPALLRTYTSSQKSIDHNQYILGNYTFQSNYQAGLRILHIDQARAQLKEVAYFDVLPSPHRSVQFQGTWSNYPYFPSGTIAVSSIEYGLFLLKVNYPPLSEHSPNTGVRGEKERSRSIVKSATGELCDSLVEHKDCTPAKC